MTISTETFDNEVLIDFIFIEIFFYSQCFLFFCLSIMQRILNKIFSYIALNFFDYFYMYLFRDARCLFSYFSNSIVFQLKFLVDVVGCDFPSETTRFSVIYLLFSQTLNFRCQVLQKLNERRKVFSLFHIYKNCVWYEREVWDMYGVFFKNNIDLRRILTDYGFFGYPLRKDFPMTGFSEIFFVDLHKTIKSFPVSLAQEYRKFFFPKPW